MELAIGVISLMWVIGILTLQRLDVNVGDFSKALSHYLSLSASQDTKGQMMMDQLAINTSMPVSALAVYVQFMIAGTNKRTDKEGLKKAAKYFKVNTKIRHLYETVLILITLLVPLIYVVDFSNISWLVYFNKDILLLGALIFFVLTSYLIEKFTSRLSLKYYPIKYSSTDKTDT